MKPRKKEFDENMDSFGYSAMDDGYNQALEEYEAWQVDKVGGLVEALENIIQHIEISSKPFAQFSSVSMIAKQALSKYKEGK